VKRLAFALLLPALAAPAFAQSAAPASAAQSPVFKSGTNVVALNVTVTDPNKQYVAGLTAGDFAVYEDGIPQQLQFFEASTVPLDLILLVDTSSSMVDKIEIVREAAKGFINTLRPGDRGAVVVFNDTVDVLQPLTSERAALLGAVDSTTAKGATALHNAIYISLRQFGRGARSSAEVRRQAVAVLSDGADTASLVSFDDVLGIARKSGVNIYTISLQSKYAAAKLAASGQRRYFSESEYAMKTLATETGAQAFFPLEARELKNIYGTIARELSSQYSIAYSPINSRPDGRYRRIVVRLTTRPELSLRTRSGYTAEVSRGSRSESMPPRLPR
jgi:VWFA-related protein